MGAKGGGASEQTATEEGDKATQTTGTTMAAAADLAAGGWEEVGRLGGVRGTPKCLNRCL